MKTSPVVIVAFQQFDNLGVGYLASVLSDAGYKYTLIDFRSGKEEILKIIKQTKPLIVGFSVIFQYYIYEFEELISFLRKEGIKCHFTAGGQYASLKTEELFKIIPSLDTIVRFEGESTFLELVEYLYQERDWKNISGIAYQERGTVIINRLRQVETDLDKYPFPSRSPLKEYAFGKKFSTILAGRGCLNSCSFCYLREYYQNSSGPYKRVRIPEEVVREMSFLHSKRDCSVYLFQDDDFPVKTGKSSEWVERFCEELNRNRLTDKVMWKINCRPDEVDYDTFSLMKKHSLFLVFLGIEDGTDAGLKRLNKHMSVSDCLEGISTLKKLEIGFDYGFMLFQPSSTFISVNENLNFLRKLCGDGYAPVTFLKMMPYAGTPVEKELRREGRLKGIQGFLDYDFHEELMNQYFNYINESLNEWLRDPDGLLNIIKWARNYFSVYSHFSAMSQEISDLSDVLKNITSESNLFLLDWMKELSARFEAGKNFNFDNPDLKSFRKSLNFNHKRYIKQVNSVMDELFVFSELQHKMQTIVYQK